MREPLTNQISVFNRQRFLFLFIYFGFFTISSAQEIINLAGEWEFKLDPKNVGIGEKWYEKSSFPDIIRLPGALQEQGYGNKPTIKTKWWDGNTMEQWFNERPWLQGYTSDSNFKIQEYLLPDRHYLGAAWYAMNIDIPKQWESGVSTLFLERCHWGTQLWVDGKAMGNNYSLGTPHEYEIKGIKPGKHRLVIRVDNSQLINLGKNAHSVSEQTAGTWNGIIGKIEIREGTSVNLENIQLYPNIEGKKVKVNAVLINHSQSLKDVRWDLNIAVNGIGSNHSNTQSIQLNGKINSDSTLIAFEFPMGEDIMLWDEFEPNLYEMNLDLKINSTEKKFSIQKAVSFGMRDFTAHGKKFFINNSLTFLRGNVDCAVFPKTGYAPMDIGAWRKVFETYKEFGLNMARFHSWCPPEAAFRAADEIGIYLAPEVGEWVWVGNNEQIDFLTKESENILNKYGNHPSFVMMGLGNESGIKSDYSEKMISFWKKKDSRHLYTIKANSKANPKSVDYEVIRGAGDPFQRIRYQAGWPPRPMNSYFQSREPSTNINWQDGVGIKNYPIVQHETAQICAYPDIIDEISKYKGYLNPSYLEIAMDQLSERGMLDQIDDFVEASGKWQVALTKEEFEAAFRTKNLAGFNWLCLADFTGQNSAPVGFTDAFYDIKSYINPKQIRNWNAPTVLLAEMPKRVYSSLKDFSAKILVSHFGKTNLELSVVATLTDRQGELIQSWELPSKKIDPGNAQLLGKITGDKIEISNPKKLILEVKSKDNKFQNSWDIWIFPTVKKTDLKNYNEIFVARKWNEDVKLKLKNGKNVLLLPKQEDLKGQLAICFTNYYWTSFGKDGGQSSATGILIDTKNPIFQNFPTENHVNWQWWDILTYAHPMIIDDYNSKKQFPKSYRPILQPIDTWKINRKLSLLSEVKVGRGKLLICSIDLDSDLDNRPVTKQLKENIFKYINSDQFDPQIEVSEETVQSLFLR